MATVVTASTPADAGATDDDPLARYPTVKSQTRLLEIYQDAFREKRAAQVATSESLLAKEDYVLQYSLSKVRGALACVRRGHSSPLAKQERAVLQCTLGEVVRASAQQARGDKVATS